jgi:hypothetical protein
MESRMPITIPPDGTWFHYTRDPDFVAALDGTARTWVHLLRMWHVEPQGAGLRLAYERAVLALAQLPIEYAGPATRFERCRWRAADVEPGTHERVHCEHPWTKKRTKRVIMEAGIVALRRNVPHEDIVAAIGNILAARQDTVLLPHGRLTQLGVLTEVHHDGFAGRYGNAVATNRLRLIDRLTGDALQPADLVTVEAASRARVRTSVEQLAGDPAAWSPALRGDVDVERNPPQA